MQDINNIVKEYIPVIKAFINRPYVQNGYNLGYREHQDPDEELLDKNWPVSLGAGLTTTGYCVSVSMAFNNSNVFKTLLIGRNAQSKLISIDIKEQYWGNCYNGDKNTWHTAILVNDSGYLFVIDLTCAQFGNSFVDKFIWDFKTWERTFRSANCKHVITDFDGAVLSYYKLDKDFHIENTIYDKDDFINARAGLNKYTRLNELEIDLLAKFFTEDIITINNNLYYGTMSRFDIDKISRINKSLEKIPTLKLKELYQGIMVFDNKMDLLKYIKKLLVNDGLSLSYIKLYKDLDNACNDANIKQSDLHKVFKDDQQCYILFQFEPNVECYDTSNIQQDTALVPFGFDITVNKDNIYNSSKIVNGSDFTPSKTNTIIINVKQNL